MKERRISEYLVTGDNMSEQEDELQKIVDELQEMVLEDAREAFTETVIAHAMNPRNVGTFGDASGFAEVTGSCGDTMKVWVKTENDTISDIHFMTDGCGTAIASGSMMTELAKGKAIDEAVKIGRQEILNALGGLPEENEHCAKLAAETLKAAIGDYSSLRINSDSSKLKG